MAAARRGEARHDGHFLTPLALARSQVVRRGGKDEHAEHGKAVRREGGRKRGRAGK